MYRVAVFVLFVFSASLFAQSRPKLSGFVQDPTGAFIAGARVKLQNMRGNTIAVEKTDAQGGFHIVDVPVGSYLLVVKEPGFKEFEQATRVSEVEVDPIRVTLTIKTEEISITVDGGIQAAKVSIEADANQNANSVDRSALDELPVFDADYVTTLSRFLDPDVSGTNGVSLVVNGVEANGPGVTASAITGVRINQNPYSALFSRPGRARLELDTESGTPQFHGSVTFLYRDSFFDAQPAFAPVKPAEQRTYYEGSLTGSLAHDRKSTFLMSLQRDNDNLQAVVDASLPSGTVHENVPSPLHHYFLSGRAFHDYGQANQIWIGYSYEHDLGANVGVGGTVLPEAGTNTLDFEHQIDIQDTHVFSPRLANLLHVLVGHNDSRVYSSVEAVQFVVPGSFTGGGAQADTFRTESHFDGTDVVTYTRGKHVIKAGLDIPDISRRGNDDFTNRLGTYAFSDLQSYQANQPFEFLVQVGSGHVVFVEKVVSGFFEDSIRVSRRLSVTPGVRWYFQNYFHDIAHDVAPRLGFAYEPFLRKSIIVRGGAGVFYDRTGPSPIADLLHYNGSNLRRVLIPNPNYPVTSAKMAAVPTSLVALDPRARIPYTLQYSLGLEQQITAKSSAAVNYVGTRGVDLFRSIDTNAPLGPRFSANPDPTLGQVRQIQSEGYLKSNSVELSFRGSPVSYFTGQVQYALAKTYNNTSGIRYFPANSYAPNADWSRSDNDRRHRLNLLGTVHAHGWFDLGTALAVNSGAPVDITTGADNNNDGVINDRPANTPRNSMHGPAYVGLDLDLSRTIPLSRNQHERALTISLNSFNVVNHQNDVTYIGVVGSSFFGQAVSALPSRRMQLNVLFKF